MSRDMRKAVITVLVCGIAWLIVGAILAPTPQSIRDWGAILFLALGWLAVGFGLGGGSGYRQAREDDKGIARNAHNGL